MTAAAASALQADSGELQSRTESTAAGLRDATYDEFGLAGRLVIVDIDESLPGFIDEETGAVTFDEEDDASNYGVIDEIARRVFLASGTVLAVRAADVPGGGPAAAILRFAI